MWSLQNPILVKPQWGQLRAKCWSQGRWQGGRCFTWNLVAEGGGGCESRIPKLHRSYCGHDVFLSPATMEFAFVAPVPLPRAKEKATDHNLSHWIPWCLASRSKTIARWGGTLVVSMELFGAIGSWHFRIFLHIQRLRDSFFWENWMPGYQQLCWWCLQ